MNSFSVRPNPIRIGNICVACVLLAVVATGCGGNPHGTVKVSGTVTVAGGPPPGPGTLSFTTASPAEGFPTRPAMAKFGADGKYVATSFEPGDGLIPGSYKISVTCYKTPPNMEGKPVVSFINKKYLSGETSGFELEVEPKSKPITFDVDLEK